MPSAASGETLAERAQRFLGLDLDNRISGELSSSDHPPPKSRSDQIAQAQRKHRQRTQSYIQALEKEVLHLRGTELSLKEEVEKLRNQLQSKHDEPQEEIPAIPIPELTPETIIIDWKDFYQTTPEAPCCIKSAEATEIKWTADTDDVLQYQLPPVIWANAFANSPLSEADKSPPAAEERTDINETPLSPQMGAKHILQLEKPCLPHLKHAVLAEPGREGYFDAPYNWGTDHAYNLSTRLFNEHKSISSPQNIQITSSDLERLLEASERLDLANEFTPVQVWALVCKLNTIHPIDLTVITSMFEELSKYSYCNSFGSAISKATIKAAFQHFLGWSHEL